MLFSFIVPHIFISLSYNKTVIYAYRPKSLTRYFTENSTFKPFRICENRRLYYVKKKKFEISREKYVRT